MTRTEMIEKIKAYIEQHEEWELMTQKKGETGCGQLGVRFENKLRTVGEIITDVSKSGGNEIDERDFPEYGTPEYDEMDDLDGVSAYDALSDEWKPRREENAEKQSVIGDHCYLIWSDDCEYGEDDHEIVMADAEVIAVIY